MSTFAVVVFSRNYSSSSWCSTFKFDLDELIESLCNLSNQMPEDGSTNWDLPPRFDDSLDEADEMVQDYVATGKKL
nr:hypothetical protein CFP56_44584 [Quercus suber]